MKVLCNRSRTLSPVQARLCPPGLNLSFSPDALHLSLVVVTLQILKDELQLLRVKENLALPRLWRAIGALPCALLGKAAVNQRSQMLTRSPVVKLECVNDALETQPDNICLESG